MAYSLLIPTLPRNIYPSVPSALNLTVNGNNEGAKIEDADANGNDDQWDGSEAGDSSNVAAMFNAMHQQNSNGTQHVAQSEPQPDEGVMRINVGLIGYIEAGDRQAGNADGVQAQIEIDRFNGIRLDSYLPGKAGFMVNAGGPVLGLDWAPQADDDKPAGT